MPAADSTKTIAAIATPAGRGGVGIVRISGPEAIDIATAISGLTPKPRYAHYAQFKDQQGELIDSGLLLYFEAPHSFTGEHVVELQGHGGPVVMDMLLQQVVSLGARLARPGEFSERAFMNDKIDLAQAEAIADLIDSASQQAVKLAHRNLQGLFSQRVQQLQQQLIHLRMYVESAIDFPEEEIDFLADEQIQNQLRQVLDTLEATLQQAQQGSLLREGIHVAIAGRPNAGKSTLLNRLSGKDSAIVTDIAGTTRDILREHIHIDGMPLHIIDTAGLRHSDDPVEQEGIKRAWSAIAQSDRILFLLDATQEFGPSEKTLFDDLRRTGTAITLLMNKSDYVPDAAGKLQQLDLPVAHRLLISAKTGEGIEQLQEHLKAIMGYHQQSEGGFMARRRHIDALQRALSCTREAQQQLTLSTAGELVAEELRQAQQHLSEIAGEYTADDLLGEIFSSFCIGK